MHDPMSVDFDPFADPPAVQGRPRPSSRGSVFVLAASPRVGACTASAEWAQRVAGELARAMPTAVFVTAPRSAVEERMLEALVRHGPHVVELLPNGARRDWNGASEARRWAGSDRVQGLAGVVTRAVAAGYDADFVLLAMPGEALDEVARALDAAGAPGNVVTFGDADVPENLR
jgi:hypothetical protein